MNILYPRTDFLKSLFPDIDITNDEQLIHAIKASLTHGQFSPKVELKKDFVSVTLPKELLTEDPKEFFKATNLCAKGKFSEARPLFEKLIEKHPGISEYYRNLAQTFEEEGNHEKAIDLLIDALKWDPKNHWALILMGNIYARNFDDTETALTYYDQVVEADPTNFIAFNNIGGAFLQAGKPDLAKIYLEKAYHANRQYPNTSYALGLLAEMENDFLNAFKYSLECLKDSSDKSHPVYKNALNQALKSAQKISDSDSGKEELVDFINQLESMTGKEIRIEKDDSIPTAATVQIAENHDRPYHLVKFKPSSGVDHLILHELVHVLYYHQAREIQENQLFIVEGSSEKKFISGYAKDIRKLEKDGIPAGQISSFMKQLFEGIMRQVFNAPVDLFIEDYIHNNFPALKAQQFLSLYKLNTEAHQAVSNPRAVELVPNRILSHSKIFNVLGARHADELFGLSFESQYDISPSEKVLIDKFWDEFIEYRDDRQPGEEYELIQHWGEDLKLDEYFKLQPEESYRKKKEKSPEEVLNAIEEDPFQLSDSSEDEEAEMAKFQKSHEGKDLNMAVAFYMIGALEQLSKKPKEEVRDIAFEIAMLGRSGISPEQKGYRVNKLPGISFSGYRLLAYYYVSWAIAIPEMLSQLQMPFDKEYRLAKTLSKH
ncbi:tetratricopeptide repeat protein [Algoriphagus vanfongensis]|uniref:tetratricopeptide repeat protein n=1 Tax=Algoriphagus vanfongensis TaxID=426371 RepID=UPI0009FEBD3E|nr:tetratricopeptide repeat protein [Algoriphagus vanfongensis]